MFLDFYPKRPFCLLLRRQLLLCYQVLLRLVLIHLPVPEEARGHFSLPGRATFCFELQSLLFPIPKAESGSSTPPAPRCCKGSLCPTGAPGVAGAEYLTLEREPLWRERNLPLCSWQQMPGAFCVAPCLTTQAKLHFIPKTVLSMLWHVHCR